MEHLKESEWLVINKVLLELYGMKDIHIFCEKILKIFRMLIPYTKGYFILLNENHEIDIEQSSFVGMTEETYRNYMEAYYEKDYLNYVFELSKEPTTYRDTDIMMDEMRKKTEFFREFLRPNNMPFGAGIILVKDTEILGVISLFRGGELGDFSDKDLFIFDVLKEHMTNIIYQLKCVPKGEVEDKLDKLEFVRKEYKLTGKEQEVAALILEGKTNAQISEVMSVSESTVKKHLYNLYAKVSVSNRLQFITWLGKI